MPRKSRHGDKWRASVNFRERYRNALACPVPRAKQLTGDVWKEQTSGAYYYPADEYLELPFANTPQFSEVVGEHGIPARIHIQSTLEKYHRVSLSENRKIFWVKFAKQRRAKLHGSVVLQNGTKTQRGVIYYVARRAELRLTALVVVEVGSLERSF